MKDIPTLQIYFGLIPQSCIHLYLISDSRYSTAGWKVVYNGSCTRTVKQTESCCTQSHPWCHIHGKNHNPLLILMVIPRYMFGCLNPRYYERLQSWKDWILVLNEAIGSPDAAFARSRSYFSSLNARPCWARTLISSIQWLPSVLACTVRSHLALAVDTSFCGE